MRRRILLTPAGWLTLLLVGCGLWGLGCAPPETPPAAGVTYTFDASTHDLIALLAKEGKAPAYEEFDRNFKGLFVPESLLPLEPFVLGLSTESRIPTILLLDAPWVQRYGIAGWLHELERSQVFVKDELVPAVAEAFSVPQSQTADRKETELVAVPTSIKGNILFYRRDLLDRYHLAPPRHWDELKAICRKIMPQEKSLKYGLILHPTNFVNDFYPIFWGCGGRIMEDHKFVLHQAPNKAAFIAALKEIQGMQGTILPAAKDMKQFEPSGTLRQTFFRGEALFMINWNTRLHDLSELLRQAKGKTSGSLTVISQVGVAPIPSQPGHARRYANLGSFGWAVNSFAAKGYNAPQVIEGVKEFFKLVTDERFQLLAAETLGQVPSLRSALGKVENKEVLQVYRDAFAAADMVIQARPHSRRLNNVLEKYLVEVLYGQRTPEAALQGALQEMKQQAAE